MFNKDIVEIDEEELSDEEKDDWNTPHLWLLISLLFILI